MENPGSFLIASFNITDAGTQLGNPVTDLAGLTALSLLARLQYGSGGATAKLYLQTTFDQGNTWCDVACIAFAMASGAKVLNLSALELLDTPTEQTDGGLADNTVVAGPLGDRVRAKLVTTGTYGNSTQLSVWGVAR